jgi:hypothetical protein
MRELANLKMAQFLNRGIEPFSHVPVGRQVEQLFMFPESVTFLNSVASHTSALVRVAASYYPKKYFKNKVSTESNIYIVCRDFLSRQSIPK